MNKILISNFSKVFRDHCWFFKAHYGADRSLDSCNRCSVRYFQYLLLVWRTVFDMTHAFVCVSGTVYHKCVWVLHVRMWWYGGASRPCRGAWGIGVGLSLLPSGSFFNYSYTTRYASPTQIGWCESVCLLHSLRYSRLQSWIPFPYQWHSNFDESISFYKHFKDTFRFFFVFVMEDEL